jgi:predicted  nucleic acid-binding Zn-ribbon protein
MLHEGDAHLEKALESLAKAEAPAEITTTSGEDWLVAPAEPAPTPKRIEVRPLPGDRLLVKMKKRRLAKRLRKAQSRVVWDYEAPPPKLTMERPEAAPAIEHIEPAPAPAAKPAAASAPLRPVEDVSETAGEAKRPALEAPAVKRPAPTPRPVPEDSLPDGEVPETVRIEAPGEYAIDVKRLMDAHPIVIQREGSYLIHLPSLFEGDEKSRRRR